MEPESPPSFREEDFICAICLDVYSGRLNMCSDCTKNFHEECLLGVVQEAENSAKDAKCPQCNATPISITRNVDLDHLIGLLRAGDTNVVCPHCSKEFASNRIIQHYDSCTVLGKQKLERDRNKFLQTARMFEEGSSGTEIRLSLSGPQLHTFRVSDFRQRKEVVFLQFRVRPAVKPNWFRLETSIAPSEESHLTNSKLTYPLNFSANFHYRHQNADKYKSKTICLRSAAGVHPLFDFQSRDSDTIQIWCFVF